MPCDDPPVLDEIADDRSVLLHALTALGGVATRDALVRSTSRRHVDRARREGWIARPARGIYALPDVDDALSVAASVRGVLSLTSAALFHGWAVKTVPDLPHVTLARGRHVAPDLVGRAHWHRCDLHSSEIVDGIVTSKEVTLMQCLRTLPPDEGLAIADSAARAGEWSLLRRVAASARGPGSRQVREVAAAASDQAANPFESVLRHICSTVPGLNVVPQVWIETRDGPVRPDLVDGHNRIIAEADSFEWHGGRAALRRDARRYNVLVIDGWWVLRFAWEDVMFEPEYVRTVLAATVLLAQGSTQRHCRRCDAA